MASGMKSSLVGRGEAAPGIYRVIERDWQATQPAGFETRQSRLPRLPIRLDAFRRAVAR